MKLFELFENCAYKIKYQQAGDSVNYAFVEDGSTLYIYFQGSNSITDWVRNFFFKKVPYKFMGDKFRVHAGFLAAWKEVEDIVINKVTKKKKEEFIYKKIIIVGYSHGAALSALAYECIWYNRIDLRREGIEGYGFEAPRMFGSYRVPIEIKNRWYGFKVIRCNNDIVTHCPLWIFGYCHVGEILKIQGDTKLVENKQPKFIKSHYPQVVLDGLKKYEND